ncbi:hypothetical protein CC86DRAFT_411327 [Ophiobolus disseminans]|uniref:Uncharacterized protein n=1 Tax=Ophiobolus disseminans TaxID=1469910 RepID=A0A6A6ZIU0_9PLEO|nr:hypothetical protein CC86DRAFT_411327 [Ophiobolus disseminans]
MPAITLLHDTLAQLAHNTLLPRAKKRKSSKGKVKFGNGYILRWQLGLIVVAIVLVFVFALWATHKMWMRSREGKERTEEVEEGVGEKETETDEGERQWGEGGGKKV